MTTSATITGDLRFGHVRCVQSATAAYDEEGLNAAAVTAVDFIVTGMPETSD